jgi:hypothetical protein
MADPELLVFDCKLSVRHLGARVFEVMNVILQELLQELGDACEYQVKTIEKDQ